MVLNQIAFFANFPNFQTVELVLGIIAGIFVLSSLTFKCTTTKMNVLMRCLNTAGCAFFVTEGILMIVEGNYAGWSLVAPNAILIVFNMYYIIKMLVGIKKQPIENLQMPKTDGAESSAQADVAEAEKAENTDVLRAVKDLAAKCETIEELRAALNDIK